MPLSYREIAIKVCLNQFDLREETSSFALCLAIENRIANDCPPQLIHPVLPQIWMSPFGSGNC